MRLRGKNVCRISTVELINLLRNWDSTKWKLYIVEGLLMNMASFLRVNESIPTLGNFEIDIAYIPPLLLK